MQHLLILEEIDEEKVNNIKSIIEDPLGPVMAFIMTTTKYMVVIFAIFLGFIILVNETNE